MQSAKLKKEKVKVKKIYIKQFSLNTLQCIEMIDLI